MRTAESQRPCCTRDAGVGACNGPLTTRDLEQDLAEPPAGVRLVCAACGTWYAGTDDEVARAERADCILDDRLERERRADAFFFSPEERERRAAARQRGLVARQAQGVLFGTKEGAA